jgi:hypothetical protein
LSTSVPETPVAAGLPFTTTLPDSAGFTGLHVGARIEVPVTRAIVGYWQPASLVGATWTVTLEAPPSIPQSSLDLGQYPTLTAELATGEFNIVWMDDRDPPAFEIYVPLFVVPIGQSVVVAADWPTPDLEQVTPTADDVAALERTRTVDQNGKEQESFTSDTRPTFDEVGLLISQAVPIVLAQLRPTFDPSHYPEIRHAAALYTATLIEGSYYREQLNEGSVQLYRQLFESTLAGLQVKIKVELEDLLVGRLI